MRQLELLWRRLVDADRLRPLACLEPLLEACYRRWRHKTRAPFDPPIPVISIGSPFLGGSGKTPLTNWIAQELGQHLKVAIISRGYRRTSSGHQQVSDGKGKISDWHVAGDELLLLARRNPNALVFADADRPHAIEIAALHGAQVACLDDAFHNQGVHKRVNVVVMHHDEWRVPPRLFPIGRLRVPLEELAQADVAVILFPPQAGVEAWQRLVPPAWMPATLPLIPARLRHAGFRQASDGQLVEMQPGEKVAAWASIALPARFFQSLAAEGLVVTGTWSGQDHVAPSQHHLQNWAVDQKKRGACYLCCTEKDAMHPLPALCLPVVYLRVELEFPLGSDRLTHLLQERIHAGPAHSVSD